MWIIVCAKQLVIKSNSQLVLEGKKPYPIQIGHHEKMFDTCNYYLNQIFLFHQKTIYAVFSNKDEGIPENTQKRRDWRQNYCDK